MVKYNPFVTETCATSFKFYDGLPLTTSHVVLGLRTSCSKFMEYLEQQDQDLFHGSSEMERDDEH